MKKLILTLVNLVITISVFAQAPEKMNYQAVARDLSGIPIVSTTVNLQFEILQASSTGAVAYSETQSTTTNQFGLFTAEIGSGTVVSGSFPGIAWGTNAYYLRVTVNGDVMPATQLLSVPYALYSKTSGGAGASLTAGSGINITGGVIMATSDTSLTNELQVLSISNDTIFLSNGGFVQLPSASGLWSANGSDIFFNTGNVGIGTNTPTSPLTINTQVGSEIEFVGIPNANIVAPSQLDINSGGATMFNANSIYLRTASTDRVSILNNGNVGIGVSVPTVELDVAGETKTNDLRALNNIYYNNNPDTNYVLMDDGTGTGHAVWRHPDSLGIVGGAFISNGTETVLNTISDNVGVGITLPLHKLSVVSTDSVIASFRANNPNFGAIAISNAVAAAPVGTILLSGGDTAVFGMDPLSKQVVVSNNIVGGHVAISADSSVVLYGEVVGNIANSKIVNQADTIFSVPNVGNNVINVNLGSFYTDSLHVLGNNAFNAGYVLTNNGFGQAQWQTPAAGTSSRIQDLGNNTFIEVDALGTGVEDIIHFTTNGVEYFNMNNGRLNTLNSGNGVFIGENAGLNDNLSGLNLNVAIGEDALRTNITGRANTAIGTGALQNNDAMDQNTAIGYFSMNLNTTGGSNVAVGSSSLQANTTGSVNVAIGSQAMSNNTTGGDNVAVGDRALQANTTASANVAVGQFALNSHVSGNLNTAIGKDALRSNTNGFNNTVLGMGAGSSNVIGASNVFIGYEAGFSELGSNKLYIANTNTATPLIWGDFATSALQVNGSLNINGAYTFPIVDGATTGDVLTTDAAGNVTWQTPSVGSSPWTLSGSDIYQTTLANKVGVGVTAPISMLHVRDANTNINSSQLTIEANNSFGAQSYSAIEFRSNFTGSNTNISGRIKSFYRTGGFTDATMTFQTVAAGPVYVDVMTLTDGKVGIGTAIPLAKLHLTGTLRLDNLTGTAPTGGEVLTFNNGTGNAEWQPMPVAPVAKWNTSGIHISSANAGNVGVGVFSPTRKFEVWDNSASFATFIQQGSTTGDGLSVYSNTSSTARTLFNAIGNSGGFYVKGNGDVGIGTSAPLVGLHVQGNEGVTSTNLNGGSPKTGIRIHNSSQTNNNYSSLGFTTALSNGTTAEMGKIVVQNINHTIGSQQGDMVFLTRNAANLNESMRIDGNGNVGIGTASPAAGLHLNKTLRLESLGGTAPVAGSVLTSKDVQGNAQWEQPVRFAAHTSSTSINSVSLTPVVFNTIEYNEGNGYNNATGVFAPPVSGYYHIDAAVTFDPTSNFDFQLQLLRNGGTYRIAYARTDASAMVAYAIISADVYIPAGNNVSIGVWHNQGGTLVPVSGAASSRVYFNAHLIR